MNVIGYHFLIEHFSLNVLPPYKKSYLTTKAIRFKEITADGEEEYFPAKFRIDNSWQQHLLFALKHEGVNLSILKALFMVVDVTEVVELIKSKKVSVYLRRIWFFYEFLLNKTLPLPAVQSGNYDYVLSPDDYFVLDEASSFRVPRQRLICNLPGNADFCPMVRLTKKLKAVLKIDFQKQLADTLEQYPAELIYRAGSFLYLKETKSSYAIERQTPTQKRITAFMTILQQAGMQELTKTLLIHLQNSIVEKRYIESDYRTDQVYVGQTMAPGQELIHFIGSKPEDVSQFMSAFVSIAKKMIHSDCNPIISASVLSFAFVFIHPFGDGNGRIHRYLLHHILAAKKFNPENIIFPVSAVLYKNARQYDRMLESFSKKLLPLVEYQLNDAGIMTVMNDTADFYRFIDFTQIAEDFFDIVDEALRTELIPELDYLIAWERTRLRMREIVDMPEKKVLQLIMFIQQNQGVFPKSRRTMFDELRDDELKELTEIIREEIFGRGGGK